MSRPFGKRGNRAGVPGDNGPNKRQNQGVTEMAREPDVSQQILQALWTQNSLLRSIDARLGRIERRDHGQNIMRRRQSPPKDVVDGSWKFAASPEYTRRMESRQSLGISTDAVTSFASYGKIVSKDMVLVGEAYPCGYGLMPSPSSSGTHGEYGDHPAWSRREDVRNFLTQLEFNKKTDLALKSGIYLLSAKYSSENNGNSDAQTFEAGIIVGEVEFNSKGQVRAAGADWDRLLNNDKQKQIPYAHGAKGLPIWSSRKISEPLEDGDELKFRIDTAMKIQLYFRKEAPQQRHFGTFLLLQTIQNIPSTYVVLPFVVATQLTRETLFQQ